MKLTIKELCDFLEAEIPVELKEKQDNEVKAVNASHLALEKGDVFFDIPRDCEDLNVIDPNKCPFIISDRQINEGELRIPIVHVNNALDRYVALCRALVDEYPDTIRIAVTGSVGKTSMKETIASILSYVASVDRTQKNLNTIYFLSKRLQQIMSENLKFYVQEAAAWISEDINLTQKLAIAFKPKIVVMTNILDNHAEIYGNRETTFQIKSSLVEEMDQSGIAFLNMDDDLLREYRPSCQVIRYSLRNPRADLYASNIRVGNDGVHFDIHWRGSVIKNVFSTMIGEHNVYNCMVGFAIGSMNGADDELLIRAIARMRSNDPYRQNHMRLGQYDLIIDCFNSSFESIENNMVTMSHIVPKKGGRKIIVLGDIAELGEKANDIHTRIGEMVARYKTDHIFYFGKYANCVYEGAKKVAPDIPLFIFTDRELFEKSIREYIRPNDLMLWKASRDTHIDLSLDALFGTDYYPQRHPYNPEEESKIRSYPDTADHCYDFEYCAYVNGIKIVRYTSICRNVILPESIGGISIRSIGYGAFRKKQIQSISFSNGLVHIGANAFLSCHNLLNVVLPKGLKFLDYSAFAYCIALEEISIPESCLLIRKKAFYQCMRLKTVIIEGMETHLEKGALLGCNKVRLKCKRGSEAEKFAMENVIPYILLDESNIEEMVITPEAKSKEIVIDSISWKSHNGKSRLNVRLSVGNDREDILWYEVDDKWKDYVNDDRIDAIVVSLFLFAIRGRYSKIRSAYPISARLKYQLEYHLIPQIVASEESDAVALEIDAPTINKVYEKVSIVNGTGFSRGVDSFATLYEYGNGSNAPEEYKVNCLNVYNVGAFHGIDRGKRFPRLSRELFEEQKEETMRFAQRYGYDALIVDSNLDLFLRTHFSAAEYGKLRMFLCSATERNIGTTLLFQKLFTRFYYASGQTLNNFLLSLDHSSGLWEQYAVQFFSTENIDFYISNRDWTRMEKIKRISEMPEAYDNLQVCLVDSKNCGSCLKCKHTLMELDVLGGDVLDRFKNSFDIEKYKAENRAEFFSQLWTEKDSDNYLKDILKEAIKNDSNLITNQPIQGQNTEYVYRYRKSRFSIMKYPTFLSEEIYLCTSSTNDDDLIIEGIHSSDWVKVALSDGRKGYINTASITLSQFHPAESMRLNAGDNLVLHWGKRYGLLPLFTPESGNEQVKYYVDNEQVVFLNKMGWIYATKEGDAVITAVSQSGLTAQCHVTVIFPLRKNIDPKGLKRKIARMLPTKTKQMLKSFLKRII